MSSIFCLDQDVRLLESAAFLIRHLQLFAHVLLHLSRISVVLLSVVHENEYATLRWLFIIHSRLAENY